jgi:magnesium-transporting ATPase (P-type)
MDAIAEEIEKDLVLMGVTAIEDKLQEGVPECIATLSMAGIKIWVLTGDKQETAINIGYSCNLLTYDMNLIIINGESAAEVKRQIERALRLYRANGPESSARCAKDEAIEGEPDLPKLVNNGPFALIIEGAPLKFALSEECRKEFLELGVKCRAVICCRVSPLQKAQVVQLVKDGKDAVTLAIGDGANDVSMIQVS